MKMFMKSVVVNIDRNEINVLRPIHQDIAQRAKDLVCDRSMYSLVDLSDLHICAGYKLIEQNDKYVIDFIKAIGSYSVYYKHSVRGWYSVLIKKDLNEIMEFVKIVENKSADDIVDFFS